jgi:hypothetical protein
MRNAYNNFIGKVEGKRAFGRPRNRWEVIRMNRREVGLVGVDWIHLIQDRNTWRVVVNHLVSVAGNLFPRSANISFSSRTLIHVVS